MSTSLCEKLKRGCKRALSGLLAVATFASLLPEVIPTSLAGDVENQPSALTVAVGDTYTVYDNGATASNLVQNGVARKMWPMYFNKNGEKLRAYCADHTKTNPGGGTRMQITSKETDMRVYGVATKSDERVTTAEMIKWLNDRLGKNLFNATNFTERMHFEASQAAFWAALADLQIDAGTVPNGTDPISWVSSVDLGYSTHAKHLTATKTSGALVLVAAIEMLKWGNEFNAVWGPAGLNHAPYVGALVRYSPGLDEFNGAQAQTGTLSLANGIVASGKLVDKNIGGTDYLVLPMAATSATFVRGNKVSLSATGLPVGAFLMDMGGNTSGGDGKMTLTNVALDNTLYPNDNNMSYGEKFYLCIPKATAEQMDQNGTPLNVSVTAALNVDQYEVYKAQPTAAGSRVQPVIIVMPAVKAATATVNLTSNAIPTIPGRVDLKLLKTDGAGGALQGAKFTLSYVDPVDGPKSVDKISDPNGEIRWENLPENTEVTITETQAPAGYTPLAPFTVRTGVAGTATATVEITKANGNTHTFKLKKVSLADNRAVQGAEFEVRGVDNNFVGAFTTDAAGEFTIDGTNLPVGNYELYEIAAAPGFQIDGRVQTFEWDNTRDVELHAVNAPLPGIEILKFDGETKTPLEGATLEIRKDGQLIQTVQTDINGSAEISNLTEGLYQVVETVAPQGYLLNPQPHEVYINPTAAPTELIRLVQIPNYKRLSLDILKRDRDTNALLAGFVFAVYKNGAFLTNVTTDAQGKATLTDLEPAVYSVREVGGLDTYLLDAPEQSVELKLGQTTVPTLEFLNTQKKEFEIIKVDADDPTKRIAGATFEISRDGVVLGQYTTNQQGQILLNNPQVGVYRVREVTPAPNYIANTTTFEIPYNATQPITFTITNKAKRKLTVRKIDKDTGDPIGGVVFEILRNNQTLGMFTTNAQGLIEIDHADPGSYEAIERHAPAGYELSTQSLKGELTDTLDLTLTMENVINKSLVILKRDSITKQPLVGVSFDVFRNNQLYGHYITDAQGKIEIRNAPAGTYRAVETATLDTYILNSTPATIEHTTDKQSELVFENVKKRDITVKKVDKDTGAPLQGVIFEGFLNGATLGNFVTGVDGTFTIPNADPGYYQFIERMTLTGYELSTTVLEGQHTADKDLTLQLENVLRKDFTIVKKDSVDKTPLQGVTFRVWRDGVLVGDYTTDAQGKITLEKAPAGTYKVQEINTLAEYILNDTPIEIEHTTDKATEVPVENVKKRNITVKKIDKDTGTALAGVVFEGFLDGVSLGNFTTGVDGTFTIENAAPGYYKFIERVTIAGYELSTVVLEGQHTATKDLVLSLDNVLRKDFTIVKKDSVNKTPLQGVTFRVWCDGVVVGDYTTDAQGKITLEKAPAGTYKVQEIGTLPEYILNDTPVEVEHTTDKETEVSVENVKKRNITVKKVDKDTGAPLQGVTFEGFLDGVSLGNFITGVDGTFTLQNAEPGSYQFIERMTIAGYELSTVVLEGEHTADKDLVLSLDNVLRKDFTIVKVDAQDKVTPLAGVQFQIWRDGAEVGVYTTDAQGKIVLEKALPGLYKVQEISTTTEYILNDTPIEIRHTTDKETVVPVENTKRPELEIIKIDPDGIRLTGAVFEVRTKAGAKVGDFPIGAGGNVLVPQTLLAPGLYVVTEIVAPDGYLLDTTPYEITLEAGKRATLTIQNKQEPDLHLYKTDTAGNPIAGVKFMVSRIEGATKVPMQEYITDAQGEILLPDLQPGTYELVETAVPAGYLLDPTPHIVELRAHEDKELRIENLKEPDLQIFKTDVEGNPLPGAKFKVSRKVGTTLQVIGEYFSDAKGEILVPDLEAGVYVIEELSVPEGYLLDPTPKEVDLIADQDTVVYIKNNRKPDLTVTKLDAVGKAPIEGAKFQIFYAGNGAQAGTTQDLGFFVSDAQGEIYLNNLENGWYKVVEVEPADGFQMKEPSEQTIYLNENKKGKLTFENTPLSALVVYKRDSVTGEPVQGAEFQLRFLGGTSGQEGTVIGQKVTGTNGSVIWTQLKAGTYIIEETRAADGYTITEATKTVYLSGKTQDVISVTFDNKPDGSLLIRKVSSLNSNQTLPDAEFKVTYADGSVIGLSNGVFTTDANGTISIPNLQPGKSVVVTETRAPKGYVIDTAPQIVQVVDGKMVTLTFKNAPYGELIIEKRDSVTGKPIPNTEFTVTDAAGGEVGQDGNVSLGAGAGSVGGAIGGNVATGGTGATGTGATVSSNSRFVTDENGQIRITGLKPGNYVITETKAAPGYVLNAQTRTITIAAGDTQTIVFGNPKKGTLTVVKRDAVTGQPLQDAEFKVTTSAGTVVDQSGGAISSNGLYTTGQDGTFTITDLEPDTYIVTETRAPKGYILDAAPQTVKVNAADHQTLTFTNSPEGTLIIKKVCSLNAETLLEGAVFEVSYADGSVIGNEGGRFTTNAQGQIVITGLTPDKVVKAVEVKAPAGFMLDSTPQTITIKRGEVVTLTFENDPRGKLIIEKRDAVTGEPIKGTQFKVETAAGCEVGQDGNVGCDGTGTITSDGYFMTDENGQVAITGLAPGSYVITETNTPDGYLNDAQSKTIVIGVGDTQTITFVNSPKATLTIVKRDADTNAPLSGAKFKVTTADGTVISQTGVHTSGDGVYTTDQNGIVTITGLLPNNYTITEVQAPTGYVLDSTPKTVSVTAAENKTVEFVNTKKGTLIIVKRDALTNAPLAGAEFKVTTSAGTVVDRVGGAISSNGLYTTDENGQIILSDLEADTYIVTEVKAPKGYVLDAEPQTIKVNKADTQTITFVNSPEATLTIVKRDADTNAPLSGAKFKVTTTDGTVISQTGANVSNDGVYTTDQNGTITITGLLPNNYIITELASPKGYVIDEAPRTVTISAAETKTVEFANKIKGTLIVRKIDAVTKKPLVGVEFKITNAQGTLTPDNEGATSSNGIYYTDENGQITLSKLDPDTYIVTETKTLPGYVLDAAPQTVVVNTADTQTLTFMNSPAGSLIITKLDSKTKLPIAGAQFKVTTSSGALVAAQGGAVSSNGLYTTDANGLITLTHLQPDTYIVEETKTIEGYVLDSTPQTVKVNAADTQTLYFYNAPKGGLRIIKQDEDTKQALRGALFQVAKPNGEIVLKQETDLNGSISLSALAEGTYIITELKAPEGYVIQSAPQTVEVKNGETRDFVFFNRKAYGLQIRKINKATEEMLAGAKFKVEKLSGERVGEYTTNTQGLINLGGLEDGVYIVSEVQAPSGYRLDTTPQNVVVKAGQLAVATFANEQLSSIRIRKLDSITKQPIAGVRFLIKDSKYNVIGEYTSDPDGYVELSEALAEGKYYIEEIQEAAGYVRDTAVKSFTVKRGETTEIVWENAPQQGQIIITKKSKDDNSINGKPAGSLLEGAVFEVYDKVGNVVETMVSDARGIAATKLLPLGRYTIKEVKAPAYYGASSQIYTAEIEFPSQIVRLEVLNESVYTSVSINKSGPKEVALGQPIRWTMFDIANLSTVPLSSFYWRDTLPYQQVALDKIVTGTWSAKLSYKIVYRTNFNPNYRTLADNLSTSVNRTIQANPTVLGLASGEAVTDIMFVFGTVPAGFRCTACPYVYGTVRANASGTAFANKCDVGGLHNQQWIMGNDSWTTTIYRPKTPTLPSLPKTGW